MVRNLQSGSPAFMLSLAIACFIGLHTLPATAAAHYCGTGKDRVETMLDFGCKGQSTAVIDIMFAIIRFLSAGVGIVIVASTVYAGIQYIVSRGDPQATANAIKRIRNNVVALGLFIFAYAILNYLIPAGFFT
jgi:hypothetical protein